jgi:hypothetical protein
MSAKCSTCLFNFEDQGDGKGRVCANVYYGDSIKKILEEKRECDDWKISFEEFCKLRNL